MERLANSIPVRFICITPTRLGMPLQPAVIGAARVEIGFHRPEKNMQIFLDRQHEEMLTPGSGFPGIGGICSGLYKCLGVLTIWGVK